MLYEPLSSLFASLRPKQPYTPLPTTSNEHSRDPSLESAHSPTLSPCKEDPNKREGSKTKRVLRIDPRMMSDATIGLSDGLTVPFALTAGLSALGDTRLVVYAGLAELIAGGISMGLGGYLGAAGEAQGHEATRSELQEMVANSPRRTREEILSALQEFQLSATLREAVASELLASEEASEDFLARVRHHLPASSSADESGRAYVSAVTIASGYVLGGLVPLLPYSLCGNNRVAFCWSVAVMAVTLFVFGYLKCLLVGERGKLTCLKAGVQMMACGGMAAAAAMGCVTAFAT